MIININSKTTKTMMIFKFVNKTAASHITIIDVIFIHVPRNEIKEDNDWELHSFLMSTFSWLLSIFKGIWNIKKNKTNMKSSVNKDNRNDTLIVIDKTK